MEPTICLSHPAPRSCIALGTALDELAAEGVPAKRSLDLKKSERKRAFSRLQMLLVPEKTDLRVMNISYDAARVIVELTPMGLTLIRTAIDQWINGAEDYCVSPRHAGVKPSSLGSHDLASGELWFWGPHYSEP